jgi:tRNA-specific 2-thiouridylase
VGLRRKGLKIDHADIHWLREDLRLKEGESAVYDLRIRYRQPLSKATLHQSGNLYIEFEDEQRGIAKGQFAAWYDGDELIGSGIIAD